MMIVCRIGISLAACAFVCLAACAQESTSSVAQGPTRAPEGNVSSLIPLENIYGVHGFFNQPGNMVQIQLPSEYTQYAWQNYSRFQKVAMIPRWGKISEFTYALDPSIGQISVDFADGSKLAVDQFIKEKPVDAFLVIKDGKILYERYETMRPFDKHIWFSVSKVTGATLLAMLEAEGKVDLSNPVSKYIPELKGTVWDTVAVVDAADMATGLNGTEHDEPNHDSRTNPEQVWFQWAVTIGVFPGSGKPQTSWDVLGRMERRKPGRTAFEYNSIDTFVVDNIVERVTGKTIAESLGEKIWRKIGAEGDAYVGIASAGNPLTFGLMNSNLRDLGRFGMIYTPMGKDMFGEEIVPASVVKHIQSAGDPEIYGKGYVGQKMLTSFFKDKDSGLTNAYMWDAIFPDGDMYKAGVGGQGLYVSPSANAVVVYFMTGTGNDRPETVARAIVNSFRHR
jgi:CubicO group peptidase (beta-lactamase class C family)